MNSKLKIDLEQIFYYAKMNENYSHLIILCIGTARIVGDSYGPIVGGLLSKKIDNSRVKVIGNLSSPVTYENIDYIIKKILKIYKNPRIVVIDSALSKDEYIGKIFVTRGKTKIANGVQKRSISFGDISIRAIVARNEKEYTKNFYNLKNTSMDLIYRLSKITANELSKVIKEI